MVHVTPTTAPARLTVGPADRQRQAGRAVDNDNGGEWIEVDTYDGTAVVRPYGEMDIARAADFRQALHDAMTATPPPNRLVVDLQNLLFCDSSGLNALVDARAAALAAGQHLSLAAPRKQFLRLLEITETTRLFTIEPAPPS
jgi:anti-sigma B factor antagonist